MWNDTTLLKKGGFLINSTVKEPRINLKANLDLEDYVLIKALQMQCLQKEQISLKLELDYKLGDALPILDNAGNQKRNEFMYFDDKQLVGYIGICSFGDTDTTLEITGMVHPDYRRQGIFFKLHDLVMSECKRRNAERILLLCDRNSVSGQEFLKGIGAVYQNSEYEMYLHAMPNEMGDERLPDLSFRKATNADADEIARQNAIYFGDREAIENNEIKSEGVILPEDEERRGMSIYLAEMDKQVIGKVHLQINNDIGGIFGLGVLPEMRKMGFGRTILIKAIAMLKDAKAREIMLQVATGNTSALGLYQSCGFRETSIMDYYELL